MLLEIQSYWKDNFYHLLLWRSSLTINQLFESRDVSTVSSNEVGLRLAFVSRRDNFVLARDSDLNQSAYSNDQSNVRRAVTRQNSFPTLRNEG